MVGVEVLCAVLLRLHGAHVAQPGPFGHDRSALLTDVVVAQLALAGENAEPTQRLLTPAAAPLTVLPAAAFGPFPLHVQQLRLQLPETGIIANAAIGFAWSNPKSHLCLFITATTTLQSLGSVAW